MPTSRHERNLRAAGYRAVAGVDEAGRGALFGPVFAGAVILNPDRPIRGLDDSKQLPPDRREVLAERIKERAIAWAVGAADAFEIDHINILQASRTAMRRAVSALAPGADYLLIDALTLDLDMPQLGLIHGDSLSFSIAAASILAKTARDRAMRAWSEVFPGYGFDSNKGYGAPEHYRGLEKFGPTPLHRYSFQPVRELARDHRWAGYPVANPDSNQGTLFACH